MTVALGVFERPVLDRWRGNAVRGPRHGICGGCGHVTFVARQPRARQFLCFECFEVRPAGRRRARSGRKPGKDVMTAVSTMHATVDLPAGLSAAAALAVTEWVERMYAEHRAEIPWSARSGREGVLGEEAPGSIRFHFGPARPVAPRPVASSAALGQRLARPGS